MRTPGSPASSDPSMNRHCGRWNNAPDREPASSPGTSDRGKDVVHPVERAMGGTGRLWAWAIAALMALAGTGVVVGRWAWRGRDLVAEARGLRAGGLGPGRGPGPAAAPAARRRPGGAADLRAGIRPAGPR